MRQREFIAAVGATVAYPFAAGAEQTSKLPTIGYLGVDPSAFATWTRAFAERLRTLGWIDGRTVSIEYRWSNGLPERVEKIATEFVHENVDVIVTFGDAVPALRRATSIIPIVFAIAKDPLGNAPQWQCRGYANHRLCGFRCRFSRRWCHHETGQQCVGPEHRSHIVVFCRSGGVRGSRPGVRGHRTYGLCARRQHLVAPLVNAINRAPIDQGATEAIYEVRVTAKSENLDEVREFLRDELEAANYPPKDIEIVEREQGDTELVAILLGTSADARELDEVVARLGSRASVENASWNLRTTE